MNEYMQAVEELVNRAKTRHPRAIVLFTSADYTQYEIYGEDAVTLSQRLNTQLLTGGEYAFNNCTKIPAVALNMISHIANEGHRSLYIQEPIKIHDSQAPMQGLFGLN